LTTELAADDDRQKVDRRPVPLGHEHADPLDVADSDRHHDQRNREREHAPRAEHWRHRLDVRCAPAHGLGMHLTREPCAHEPKNDRAGHRRQPRAAERPGSEIACNCSSDDTRVQIELLEKCR